MKHKSVQDDGALQRLLGISGRSQPTSEPPAQDSNGQITQLPPSAFELGIRFLLTEFDAIRSFKEQSVSISDKRVDVFLTITSVFVAGFGLMSQSGTGTRNLMFIALVGSISLLIVGVSILHQVVKREIMIVDYIRAINRIRAYFAEQAPQIQPFLLMPISHKYPPYDWPSSNRRIIMVINSLASGLIGAITFNFAISTSLSSKDFSLFLTAVCSFALIYLLQEVYARRFFRRAEALAHKAVSVSIGETHRIIQRKTKQ